MFDKEAIEALQNSVGIAEASNSVGVAISTHAVVGLPGEFSVHDLEKYQATRRRARGNMRTSSLSSFATYVGDHAEDGATVFVDQDSMSATAVLNLGTPEAPGHADNRAKLEAKTTAAFRALTSIANGQGKKQTEVAEFLEDWPDLIKCFNDEGAIQNPRAIAAVRKITIEALRKLESEEQSLSASRSAFESVAATSKEPLPTHVYFRCQPYADLSERDFMLRLGVLTGNDKPAVSLRIVKWEEHQEEMATELAEKIGEAFDGESMLVVLGTYIPSN